MQKEDLDHLRLLSIFHYVFGALSALMLFFPLIYLALGLAMLVSPDFAGEMEDDPEEARIIAFAFIGFSAVFMVLGVAVALCLILAGRFIARQTHYIFCMVIAALECLSFPFGTILGVFTLIVLSRESVKQLFGRGAPPPPMPGQVPL